MKSRMELPTLAEYLPQRSTSADDSRDEEMDIEEREAWEELDIERDRR